MQFADAVVATCTAEADLLARAYRIEPRKVHVVPNAADVNVFGDPDRRLFQDHYGESDYLLTVGRIEPNKNQLTLIRAVRGLGVRLVIVGRAGDGHAAYELACRREGEGHVRFIDHLPYGSPLLASAYAGSRAFVLPSLSEIAPNSLIEAAMSGTTVVATRNSVAAYEWFGDDVLYLDPRSERDVENVLRRALTAAPPSSLRRQALGAHSWAAVCEQLRQVYSSVTQ
jgi:glycosyltransferase involved in cell wall biosynthesis